MSAGYLVVQKVPTDREERRYAGVGRIPAYELDASTYGDAMEEYVFGDIKDAQTNLIPSRRRAARLRRELNKTGRQFELIYCRSGEDLFRSQWEARRFQRLGYDVAAVRADYWSIVEDFCREEWANVYRRNLNENGLFSELSDAQQYLNDYRAHGLADADAPLEVVEISRIE